MSDTVALSISQKLLGGNEKLLLNKRGESSAKKQLLRAKAISLWQPWASLISLGFKEYETRSWQTSYRGKLVICSAKKNSKQQRQDYSTLANKYQIDFGWDDLPFGQAIIVCDLSDCIEMTNDFIQTISETEKECGDWQVGRYAWKLGNIQVLDNPIPVLGKQGLWNIELDSNLSLSPVNQVLVPCKQSQQPPHLLGQKKKCQTDNDISPSKNSRRKKGTGSGYINWRTTKKNGEPVIKKDGTECKQPWFHYELWDKVRQVKSCKYIPKKMRSQIQKMNDEKAPVEEILRVLQRKKKKR